MWQVGCVVTTRSKMACAVLDLITLLRKHAQHRTHWRYLDDLRRKAASISPHDAPPQAHQLFAASTAMDLGERKLMRTGFNAEVRRAIDRVREQCRANDTRARIEDCDDEECADCGVPISRISVIVGSVRMCTDCGEWRMHDKLHDEFEARAFARLAGGKVGGEHDPR